MNVFLFLQTTAKHFYSDIQQHSRGVVPENTREMPAAVIDLKPADKADHQGHHRHIAGNEDKMLQPTAAVHAAFPPAFLGGKMQDKRFGFRYIEL